MEAFYGKYIKTDLGLRNNIILSENKPRIIPQRLPINRVL